MNGEAGGKKPQDRSGAAARDRSHEAPENARIAAAELLAVVAKEPYRAKWTFVLYFVMSLVFVAVPLVIGFQLPALVSVLAGVFFAFFGAWAFSVHGGMRIIAVAVDQLAMGRLDVADALLDVAVSRYPKKVILKHTALVRSHVALARGDIDGCRRQLATALTTATGPLAQSTGRAIDLAALSIRAFAAAAAGESEAARRDIAAARDTASRIDLGPAVLAGERAIVDPLARVALAEAVLLARAGDHATLRVQLQRFRELILDGSPPRDRKLFRGLERMARARVSSPYRAVARPEPSTSGDEPSPEEWIERVLPEVAPFVGPSKGHATAGTYVPAATAGGASEASSAAGVPRLAQRRGPGVQIIVWLGVVAVATMVGRLALPTDIPPDEALGWVAPPFLLTILVALTAALVLKLRRLRVDRRALQAAYTAAAKGDRVEAEVLLEAIPSRAIPYYAARAELSLAQGASRRGLFQAALVHAERGLGRLALRGAGAIGDALRPDLVTERATAMAATGRTHEAVKEIESLRAVFAGRARSVFRVRLVAHLAAGEFAEAAALAASRSPQLPLDARTELLADLACAAFGEEVGLVEAQRLRDDLAREEERAFVEATSPELLKTFDEAARVVVDDDPGLEARRDAAHEAEAEAEIEIERSAAPRVARSV